jgi:two-component system nitrate/nitrite response regulator NarL
MGIRAVVADNDDAFRSAAMTLLEADPRFEVVGGVADGAALTELAEATAPDVVLLDVRMPSGGSAAASAIAGAAIKSGRRAGPLVVAVSADTSPHVIEEMLRAGAVGYLAKGRLGASLGDLLARINDGEVIIAAPNASLVLHRLLRQDEHGGGATAVE